MMSKRGIVALLLAMCLVLTTVPAFALQITVEPAETIVVPEEGVTLSGSGSGAATKLSSGIAIVLAENEEKKLGIQNAANIEKSMLNGLEISGTITYKLKLVESNGVVDTGDELTEFTVSNLPVEAARATSKGGLCLEFSKASIVAHSPELTDVAQLGKEGGNFNMAEIALSRGTWTPPSKIVLYESDDFPEGTVFLAAQNFTVESAQVDKPGAGAWSNYYVLNAANSSLSASTIFIPKESGEYEIWMMASSHGGTTDNRTPTMQINGVTATIPIDKTNYGNTQMIWAKSDATVTLTANDLTTVNITGKGYARFGGAAFVPVNAENKPEANFATKSGDAGRISLEMLAALQKQTTVQLEAGPDVSVTVDGKAVQAKAWASIPMGTLDAAGELILNPTVADALSLAGKTEPATGRMLVYMDGVPVVNPNVTYVKQGAVITTETKADGFKPVVFPMSMGGSNSAGQCAFGLYGLGTDKVRVMLGKKYWASQFTDISALQEARITGLLRPRDVTGTAKFGTTNGHVVFYGKPLVSMNLNYVDNGGNELLEAVVEGLTVVPNNTGKSEVDRLQALVYDDNGEILGISSNKLSYDVFDYCSSDLYITDKYTTAEVYALDNGDHTLITVDGAEDLYIVTATYDEKGNLIDTSIQTKPITLKQPLALKAGDNQKIYVWRNHNFIGTTMEPICAPITK